MYSASSAHIDNVYFDSAEKLGRLLAMRNIRMINGGGNSGLMGTISDAVLSSGGEVIGVIPQFMIAHKWCHTRLTSLIETESIHERKRIMAEKSDAIIALPGGCGTLEELLEIITWKQLGLYLNPIVILNINGYFDPLLVMLNRALTENFMPRLYEGAWYVACTPEEAVEAIYEIPIWDVPVYK